MLHSAVLALTKMLRLC